MVEKDRLRPYFIDEHKKNQL